MIAYSSLIGKNNFNYDHCGLWSKMYKFLGFKNVLVSMYYFIFKLRLHCREFGIESYTHKF